MRESERAKSSSRREFLRRATVGVVAASAALLVGEEMFAALEQLAPRALLVPGITTASYPEWEAVGTGQRLTLDMIERAAASIYGVPIEVWRKHMDDHRRAAVAEGANPPGGYRQHDVAHAVAHARFITAKGRGELCLV